MAYKQSEAEEAVLEFILAHGYPEPERQAMLVPGRRFQTDFYWSSHATGLEVEGGVYVGGRHVNPSGFEGDIRKYNAIAAQGIRLFRVMPQHTKPRKGDDEPYLLSVLRMIFGP
jgi:hypothetical protein